MLPRRFFSFTWLHAECKRNFHDKRLNLKSSVLLENRRNVLCRTCKSGVQTKSCELNRGFQTSCLSQKEDRREKILSAPRKDEGVEGERTVDLDGNLHKRSSMFPDENTPNSLFDGVRYAELPICHVKSSHNNTIMNVTDHKGSSMLLRSCGMEGFKNAKKGTNIAAQATGISLGMKILEQGVKTVRIKIQGLGPGRMASVKGLQMAGVNIVSITDDTPLYRGGLRPRKQRRL